MPLWGTFDILAKARKLEQEKAQRKAAEAAAKEEAERPPYTPEEEREIQSLYTPDFTEREPHSSVITMHVNEFFEKRPPEHVKKFAYYCLRHGFNFSADKARKLAEIVAANKVFLRGGFMSSSVSNQISDDVARMKEGTSGRNLVRVVLNNPAKYRQIFEVFYKRPPGGTPLFTREEWESMPPRRGSGSGA